MSLRPMVRKRSGVSFRRAALLFVATILCGAGVIGTGQLALGQDRAVGGERRGAPLLVVISVDGLRPDYVTQADAHGAKIPNLRRFLKEGTYAEGVQGVVPTVTYPSHTTLMTGVWPAKHGIYANTTFDPLQKNFQGWYWYAEDIRVPTLWEAAAKAGRTTASIQWPVTVGAHIDWVIPEFWRANTPEDAKLLRAVSTPGLIAEASAEVGPYSGGVDPGDFAGDRPVQRRSRHDCGCGHESRQVRGVDFGEEASGVDDAAFDRV